MKYKLSDLRSPFISIILNLFVLNLFSYAAKQFDIYVSPDGSDNNPGTLTKPIASLNKAQAIITQRKNVTGLEIIDIYLREGTYFLSQTLIIDPNSSGGEKLEITYSPYNNEKAIITAGTYIKGTATQKGNLWVIRLGKRYDFRNLYVNNKRAQRARYPNKGYLKVNQAGQDKRTNFTFDINGLPKMRNFDTLELVFFHDWSISRIGIKRIDYNNHTIFTTDPIGSLEHPFFAIDGYEKHPRFYLENSLEFLDEPGEWFLDKANSLLYYYPLEGQKVEDTTFIAPGISTLVKLQGDMENEKPIKNLHFKNLTFAFTGWDLPSQGYCEVQACFYEIRPDLGNVAPSHPGNPNKRKPWSPIPSAVKLIYAKNCSFTGCQFQHLGNSALWFEKNCRNNLIQGNLFDDISANAIMLGEDANREIDGLMWFFKAPYEVSSENIISDNIITECGNEFFGAVAIWAGLTEKTKIKNNLIFNIPYTGISSGWIWSNVPTVCAFNVIENNHIHHAFLKLSDGGAIYNLGRQPGSVIRANLVHDIAGSHGRAPNQAFRFDNGGSGFLVTENVAYNIKDPILWFNPNTHENKIIGNYFVLCPRHILLKEFEDRWNQLVVFNHTQEHKFRDDIVFGDNIIFEGPDAMEKIHPYVEKIKKTVGPDTKYIDKFVSCLAGDI